MGRKRINKAERIRAAFDSMGLETRAGLQAAKALLDEAGSLEAARQALAALAQLL